MIRELKNKIKNKKGETMAEVLISVLISGLALLLLLSMILAANHVLDKGEEIMGEYYDGISYVEAQRANASPAGGRAATVSVRWTGGSARIPVVVYADDESGLAAYEPRR